MKSPHLLRLTVALCLAAAATLPLHAQSPAFVSPEIGADGRVTFRYHAPEARTVALRGLRRTAPQPMSRDAAGVWTLTVPDLAPDIYDYHFEVDGAVALDPRNRSTKKWINSESAFELTGATPPLWAMQPVPHGTLHRHTFTSAVAGREYSFQVYTPPSYDPTGPQRHPVVYLLHGYGDDETAWAENGRAHLIADNLIARGAMKPALIVMPHGHPLPFPLERVEEYFPSNLAAMERLVTGELLPFVERHYRASMDPQERAIVGLSMGGGHALGLGLNHPELFQWVGAFSAAVPLGEPGRQFPRLRTEGGPRLLWIAIGRDDFLLQRNEAFRTWLGENRVRFDYTVGDGGHEWTNWRTYLEQFLPLLFR